MNGVFQTEVERVANERMADGYLGKVRNVLGEVAKVLKVEVMARVDSETHLMGAQSSAIVRLYGLFGACVKSAGISFGIEFNTVHTGFCCRFNHALVGVNKDGGANTCIVHFSNNFFQKRGMGDGVPTRVTGEHIGWVGHEGNLVGLNPQYHFQKLIGRIPLNVKFCLQGRRECFHIRKPYMSLIRTGVHSNALGPEALTIKGHPQHIGVITPPCVSQSGNLIDVYAEPRHEKSLLFALCSKVSTTRSEMMTASDIKTNIVPCLEPSDSFLKALQIMEEYRVVQVPVVSGSRYLGLVMEDDALAIEDLEDPISAHENALHRIFVLMNQHVFDIIKLIAEFRLSLVAVTDEHEHYLGCITTESLIHQVAQFSSVRDPGSIIVLDLNQNDYSMSEVARIVEGNDAKILSSFVTSHSDSTRIELTLKINRSDLSGIIQTFNRFNYTVSASYHESKMDELLHSRYEELMKYLNM